MTFECPYCKSEFKLNADEFQCEDNTFIELYCPYCGLPDEVNEFYNEAIMEQVEIIAQNYMYEQLNQMFSKTKRSINKNKLIKMEYKPLKKTELKELKDKDTVEMEFRCDICGNHEKVLYCAGASKVFCAYCGVDL